MKKGFWLVGAILLLAIGCAGCGKKQTADSSQSVSAKDYVYKYESFHYEDGNCNSLLKGGADIYAYGYDWDEKGTGGQQLFIKKLNTAGEVQEEGIISFKPEESIYDLKADNNGCFYGIKNYYSEDGEGNYTENYYLCKYTMSGEEQFCIELKTMPQLQKLITEEYFYAGSLMIKESDLYVNVMGTYVKFDTNGNFVKLLEGAAWDANKDAQLYALENGKVVAISYGEEGNYVSYADMETGEFSQKTKVPGNSYEYSFFPGVGYDLYLTNSYGVFGYNIGEENIVPIMNYMNSDFNAFSIYNIAAVSETEFWGTYEELDTGNTRVGKFTKVDPADVKDKTVITLACHSLDWEVRMAVFAFNKNNEKYKVIVQDYNSLYGVENDYMASVNRLNTDIVSGKIPDILLLDSNMPVKSYIAKGLLEDIKPYIEKDPELDMNNFMPNIIEAFSVDGKLYQIVPQYCISTLVAKASVVGEKPGWTAGKIMELMEKTAEGTELLSFEIRENMLINCMTFAGDQFVDWNSGKCNFESEEFKQLLAFLAMFPEEIDNEAFTDEYWMNYESMWREGKIIAQPMSVYDFRNYNYTEKGTFGEKITLIGYPSGEGSSGSAIVPTMQFAMSAKSKCKEGAWEFLRYFLTDEYQESENVFGLPLSIKKLDEMAEEATKVPTYTDENGNIVESPETYYVSGIEVPITPMTQEEADALKEQIYSITDVSNYDENLIQIIQEESAAYFGGQKSAEEVSKIIQSRAQIYINENR